MKQFTLSAKERLKSRKQIGLVFNKGRHLNMHPLRVSWYLEEGNAVEPLQVGVGASGRNFKRAVDRNRIKRLLRESWRLQKLPLKDAVTRSGKKLSVFLIYTGRELPEYKDVSTKVREAIDKLMKLFHENNTQDT